MLDQLKSLNKDGSAPESRIARAKDAFEIWNQLRMADAASSFERARWDAMYDNTPPLNQAKLDASGQGHRVNVSWGFAPMVLEMAQSGYIDILNSTESFFECPTTADLPPEQRQEAEQIIAEEVTNCIRSWEDFSAQYLRNTSTFIKQAVSFVTFDDEWDWRFDSKGLSDFKIPRKTKVGQDNINVACWLRFYSATELYQFIKEPEVAKANGWDEDAVKKAILQSVNNSNTFNQNFQWNWEKLEVELRNNDFFWTYGVAQTQNIRIVHLLWQEFDGRFSYGAICDDQQQNEEWLCRKVDKYESSYNAFITYTYGVGNDYYHGIRGQGYTIFPVVGALNRAYSQLLEVGMYGSAPIFQPNNESAMQNMQCVPMGAYTLLTPDITITPAAMAPNLSTGVLPIISQFTNLFREQTANANTQSLMETSKEMSATEVNARLGSVAKMSMSSLSVYYPPWEATLREMVRRMTRRGYSELERGGKYIVELRKKLLKRGGQTLLDAFYNLDTTRLRAKRAIGSGSEAARLLAFNQLMQVLPYLPESGRQNLIRDFVAGYVTYRNADRYTSPASSPTLTNQEGVAWTQNALLIQGQFQPVLPNEDLFVHARVHSEVMPHYIQQAEGMMEQAKEAMGANQPIDLNPIASALQGLQMLNAHFTETVQRIAINPEGAKLTPQYKQLLQQADEIIYNSSLALQRMMEVQASQSQENQPQLDPEAVARIQMEQEKNAAQIENIQAKTQATTAKTQADITAQRQKTALEDAKTAEQIRSSAQKRTSQRRIA